MQNQPHGAPRPPHDLPAPRPDWLVDLLHLHCAQVKLLQSHPFVHSPVVCGHCEQREETLRNMGAERQQWEYKWVESHWWQWEGRSYMKEL